MFSNLSTGSVLYILDTKNDYKLSSGQVNTIGNIRPKYATFNPNVGYNQNIETVLDITVTVDGEKKEYKQIPANASIANFGTDAFIIADSKDAMLNHVNATLQNSKSIIESVDKHKAIIANCEQVLKELNPTLAAEAERDNAINKLQNQVSVLTEQLSRALSLLNPETQKQNNYDSSKIQTQQALPQEHNPQAGKG